MIWKMLTLYKNLQPLVLGHASLAERFEESKAEFLKITYLEAIMPFKKKATIIAHAISLSR